VKNLLARNLEHLGRLRHLLADHRELAAARLGDDHPGGMTRSLLHVAVGLPRYRATSSSQSVMISDIE
jgi:hypothetical protein